MAKIKLNQAQAEVKALFLAFEGFAQSAKEGCQKPFTQEDREKFKIAEGEEKFRVDKWEYVEAYLQRYFNDYFRLYKPFFRHTAPVERVQWQEQIKADVKQVYQEMSSSDLQVETSLHESAHAVFARLGGIGIRAIDTRARVLLRAGEEPGKILVVPLGGSVGIVPKHMMKVAYAPTDARIAVVAGESTEKHFLGTPISEFGEVMHGDHGAFVLSFEHPEMLRMKTLTELWKDTSTKVLEILGRRGGEAYEGAIIELAKLYRTHSQVPAFRVDEVMKKHGLQPWNSEHPIAWMWTMWDYLLQGTPRDGTEVLIDGMTFEQAKAKGWRNPNDEESPSPDEEER
jgi:hypothetical protein